MFEGKLGDKSECICNCIFIRHSLGASSLPQYRLTFVPSPLSFTRCIYCENIFMTAFEMRQKDISDFSQYLPASSIDAFAIKITEFR